MERAMPSDFWRQMDGRLTVRDGGGPVSVSERSFRFGRRVEVARELAVAIADQEANGVDRAANGGEWARDGFCIELGMLEAHLAGRLGSADNGTLW
jgi:hypothetical protein